MQRRARLTSSLSKLAEAEAAFRQMLKLKPAYGDGHSYLGLVLRERNRLGEAEAESRLAVRHQPNDADSHFDLGVLLQAQAGSLPWGALSGNARSHACRRRGRGRGQPPRAAPCSARGRRGRRWGWPAEATFPCRG